jgi:hypothetical protein
MALMILSASRPAVGKQPAKTESVASREVEPVLVLLVAADALGKAREQRFISELELALDGIRVLGIDPGMPAFAEKPLAVQILIVRELLDRHHGVAATWLNMVSHDLILLNMVVLSSSRALVRLVEGNPQYSGFTVDLAMATRELLGTAFLFKPVPVGQETLASVVEKVREAAAPTRQAVRSARWTVIGRGAISGGLAGFVGPSLHSGGNLVIERRLWQGLRSRVLLQAQVGPFGAPAREVESMMVNMGLGLGYLWALGPVLFGPAANLSACWTQLWVKATATSTQGFSYWAFRADMGPEIRLPLMRDVTLVGSVSVGLSLPRKVLNLRSTGATYYASPFVVWQGMVGFALDL